MVLSRRRVVTAMAAGAGALALGCRSELTDPGRLRLGYFLTVTHAPAIVAIERGLIAAALGTVPLEPFTFHAGPAAIEALLSGALDAAYVGPNPAINAFIKSRGQAVRIVAGATSGGAALVVRPEISKPEDLRGHQVASPQLGGTQDVALRTWLARQGLPTEITGGGDVSVVPQDNAQAFERLRTGTLAGAWVPEPWVSRMVLEAGAKVLVEESSLWPDGKFTTTVLLARRAAMQQYPARIEALVRGHVEALKWMQMQPVAARELVGAALERGTGKPLPAPVLARAFASLQFTSDPQMPTIERSAADAAALGLLRPGEVPLAELYDSVMLQRAEAGLADPR